MENFEQLVRKTMKEHGIDDRLTNMILSNKSPEEITKAIEKPNLMCRLVSTAMLTTKNARDSLKEHTKKEED